MIRGVKIRILPTHDQEQQFWKSCGIARWAYNNFLMVNEIQYRKYQDGLSNIKYIKESDYRKNLTLSKKNERLWLGEVSANVYKVAVLTADIARKRYLNGISGKPKPKIKFKSKPSFYVNSLSLKRTGIGFKGEKLGEVKTKRPLPRLKRNKRYKNPHISFDGKYWFISLAYETDDLTESNNKYYKRTLDIKHSIFSGKDIGIDLGIKDFAVIADKSLENVKHIENINKSKTVLRLEKSLKRQQRKISRKIEMNTIGRDECNKRIYRTSLNDCTSFQKQARKIHIIYRRLNGIRRNHIHQSTAFIVKSLPSKILLEDLNVSGMIKNRHLAKAIQAQNFFEFKRQIKYKSLFFNISLFVINRWYPSSKKCSRCGKIKSTLNLHERIYCCPHCGLTIDRDENAALNIANYSI